MSARNRATLPFDEENSIRELRLVVEAQDVIRDLESMRPGDICSSNHSWPDLCAQKMDARSCLRERQLLQLHTDKLAVDLSARVLATQFLLEYVSCVLRTRNSFFNK